MASDHSAAPTATTRWSARGSTLLGLGLLLAVVGLGLWRLGQPAGGRLIIGLLASLLIGLLAGRRGWLAPSGIVGAVLTGSLTLAGGGLAWGGLLVVFFTLSSLLSRWRRQQKEGRGHGAAKGSQRDLGQTLANGGLAAGLAVAVLFWPSPLLHAAFVGALAAVTADTWSTELGLLSRQPPRLVTTGRPVPAGTNGALSLMGTLAGAAGGLTIGLAAWGLATLGADWGEPVLPAAQRSGLPLLGLLAGIGGGLADSLLGATVQGVRWCPTCGVETERAVHHCGQPTRPRRGWSWLDNDRVNGLASAVGALIGAGLASLG